MRHDLVPCPVALSARGMGEAPAPAALVARSGLALGTLTRCLGARPRAVDLAAIAATTHPYRRAARATQELPARLLHRRSSRHRMSTGHHGKTSARLNAALVPSTIVGRGNESLSRCGRCRARFLLGVQGLSGQCRPRQQRLRVARRIALDQAGARSPGRGCVRQSANTPARPQPTPTDALATLTRLRQPCVRRKTSIRHRGK